MVALDIRPTNNERRFGENELIVSRTDTRGIITYCNRTFVNIAGYNEVELLGKPHSIIRHPDMPRCVFQFLWDVIVKGEEIFAYVKNMARNGDYYWVIAHVTPTYDHGGNIIGYHSNRRSPKRSAVEAISGVYAALLDIERKASSSNEGMKQAYDVLIKTVQDSGKEYNEFILSI
jgi:PAS domain S-box-containing protein